MTEKIQNLKPQEFISEFENLLLDKNTHNMLVRGYFDEDKLLLTFGCLGDLESFNEGEIIIGTTTVSHEKELIQRGLRKEIPKLNLSDSFSFNNLSIRFLQWKRNSDFPFGFDKDFAVFHPVESVLDTKDFSKFCNTMKNAKARKNILITTNDFYVTPEKLYPYVDRVLILDTTQVNKEHQQTYNVIQDKLKVNHKSLPY